MWRKHAVDALHKRHNSLCAEVLAYELIEDILVHMLEGWHFGEWQPGPEPDWEVPSDEDLDEKQERLASKKAEREKERLAANAAVAADQTGRSSVVPELKLKQTDYVVDLYHCKLADDRKNRAMNKEDEAYEKKADEDAKAVEEAVRKAEKDKEKKKDMFKTVSSTAGLTRSKSLAQMEREANEKTKQMIEQQKAEKFGNTDTKDDGAVAAVAPGKMQLVPAGPHAHAPAAAGKKGPGSSPRKKKKIPFDKFSSPPKKIARDGNEHEQALDFTERTIKFALFTIALMYFRGLFYLRRELREKEAEEKKKREVEAGSFKRKYEEHRPSTLEEMRELEKLRKEKVGVTPSTFLPHALSFH